MLTNSEGTLRRVTQQLLKLEKRDWELWAIISVTGVFSQRNSASNSFGCGLSPE